MNPLTCFIGNQQKKNRENTFKSKKMAKKMIIFGVFILVSHTEWLKVSANIASVFLIYILKMKILFKEFHSLLRPKCGFRLGQSQVKSTLFPT